MENPISDMITPMPFALKLSRASWTRRDFSLLAAASLIPCRGHPALQLIVS
jgi:hypothetical protein